MAKLLFGKQLESFSDIDIDDLLSKLTPEEIEELNSEMDPDDHLLPASDRCKVHTTKEPTGPYDREKLIKFLEDKAKEEKDWEEKMPFEKKTRGKVYVTQKTDSKMSNKDLAEMGFDTEIDTEFDDALKNASEEELVDLAAVLGFTGMLNQVQFHSSLENKSQECGGFQGVAKHEKFKAVDDEPPNQTDVEDTIKKVAANDSKLEEVNLNNIKNISPEQFARLCDALADNTNLKRLFCANTALTNPMGASISKALSSNTGLEAVNLESNFFTGDTIIGLITAVSSEKSHVTTLLLANQRQRVLGVRGEMEITRVVQENKRLLKLGIDLETMDARIKIREHLAGNIDQATRLKRRSTSRD